MSDVYTAEKILAHKNIRGRRHYLIKWLDWDNNHNTWEPEKNIFDPQLIDHYFESLKGKKNRVKQKEDVKEEETPDEKKDSIDSENDLRVAKRIAEGLRPIKNDSQSRKNSNLKRVSSSNSFSSESSSNSLNKTQNRRKISSSVSVSSSSSTRKNRNTPRKNRIRSYSESDESSHHKLAQEATTDFDSDTDKDEIIKSLKRNKISDSSDEDEKKSIKSSKSKTRKDSDSDSLNTFLTSNTNEEIVITDITSGVVTVTIKECVSPDGFFKRRDT